MHGQAVRLYHLLVLQKMDTSFGGHIMLQVQPGLDVMLIFAMEPGLVVITAMLRLIFIHTYLFALDLEAIQQFLNNALVILRSVVLILMELLLRSWAY
jgi:hypothetical protein